MENNILLTSTIWHYVYLTSSGIVEGTSTSLNSYSDLIDCDGYDTLTILAAVWRTIQPCCLFYKEDGSIAGTFQFGMDASQSVTNARIYEIDIPEDAKTFRTTCFNTHKEKWFASLKKGKGIESLVHDALYSHKTITPVWSGGNNIDLSDNPNSPIGNQIRFGISALDSKTNFHTDIYNVKPGSSITINGSDQRICLVIAYLDNDYIVKSFKELRSNGTAWNDEIVEKIPNDVTKIIIQGYCKDGSKYFEPSISVSTHFNTDKATSFFPLPPPGENNINYQHLTIKIELTDLTLNTESAVSYTEPQEKYVIDHGILALPKSYTPDGEATRMVVFTHGAAVNYSRDASKLSGTDIKPEYWLSEGYAIMDMDGTISGSVEMDGGTNYGVFHSNHDGTYYGSSHRNHYYVL